MSRLPLARANWNPEEVRDFLRRVATRLFVETFTWDPPSVGATTTTDTTLTTTDDAALEGLRAGQPVFVTPPSNLDAGLIIGAAWIPADNQLTIRLRNTSASPVNQGSGTWGVFSFIA